MDYTNTDFWIAIGVGGSVIASLSAGQQLVSKEEGQEVSYRAVFRDFCFGAFITAILYMFLPESIHSWISVGQSAVKEVSKGVSGFASSKANIFNDYELQTGPARF
jgi:hypothetical protein